MERKSKLEKSESSSELQNGPNEPQTTRKTKDGLLHVSELNRRMQEMVGKFMLLEEYFMIESVKKVWSNKQF